MTQFIIISFETNAHFRVVFKTIPSFIISVHYLTSKSVQRHNFWIVLYSFVLAESAKLINACLCSMENVCRLLGWIWMQALRLNMYHRPWFTRDALHSRMAIFAWIHHLIYDQYRNKSSLLLHNELMNNINSSYNF